jgi:steroid delta-isomerase-like uncharacterized protein
MLYENNSIVASAHEQRWIEGLNQGDLSVAQEVFHPDCVIHINGGPKKDLSLEEFKGMLTGFLTAFPDMHFTVEDQVMDGQKVSSRWHATATHTAPLGELPATGRSVEIDGIIIDHLEDGKVSERWEVWDQAAMMQQLGM